MKTTSSSNVSSASRAAVEAVIHADKGISPQHRRAILRACDTPPGQAAELVTATEAAARLGVSTMTVTRWIDNGKLDGFRIGQRTTVATVASVEAMKAHLEKNPLPKPQPADPLPVVNRSAAAPLPDRLAHLSPAIQAAKPPKKSNRG